MDPANFGPNLSVVRDHLPFFLFLLFGLPVMSFIGFKFWIVGHSARVQRTTHWFVPTEIESDAARMHFSLQHNSVAFNRQVHRKARHAGAARNASSRRSA